MSLAALAMDLCFLRIDGLVSMPTVARPIVLMWFLWLGGLARIDARPLALCGLLKRFAHRPNS